MCSYIYVYMQGHLQPLALTNSSSVMLKYLFRVPLGGDGIHLIRFLNAGIFFSPSSTTALTE